MTVCYLGIGTNVGNRYKNITRSLKKVNRLKGTHIVKVSGIFRTKPVGGPKGQKQFFNAAIKIDTTLLPYELLRRLKEIEQSLGRKDALRWGPRVIDLDILFFGNRRIHSKRLTVPHARVFARDFVKKPLSEIIW